MDTEALGLICCAIVPLGCLCIGFVIAASMIDDDDLDAVDPGETNSQDATH